MPIRFSTEAANADHMRMEAETGVPEGMPDAVGADGTPRDRADRTPQREPKGGAARADPDRDTAARPGKDVNASGSARDKDAGKP